MNDMGYDKEDAEEMGEEIENNEADDRDNKDGGNKMNVMQMPATWLGYRIVLFSSSDDMEIDNDISISPKMLMHTLMYVKTKGIKTIFIRETYNGDYDIACLDHINWRTLSCTITKMELAQMLQHAGTGDD